MKLNPDKFYVVYKPAPDSEMADIFSGRSNDMNGFRLQFKGGMKPEQVYGLYNDKDDAQMDANTLFKKRNKTSISKGSSNTYGIYESDGTFKFKKEIASQKELQDYLDQMYAKGKHYAAYKLAESPKKITKAQLKRFKKKIDTSDLNDQDMDMMMQLYIILESNPASAAMTLAHSFDTFQRELIPNDIWKNMGGTLNKP